MSEIYWEKHLQRIKGKKQEGRAGKKSSDQDAGVISVKGEKEWRAEEEQPQTLQIWESLGHADGGGVPESKWEEPLKHEEPSASTCMLLSHWLGWV